MYSHQGWSWAERVPEILLRHLPECHFHRLPLPADSNLFRAVPQFNSSSALFPLTQLLLQIHALGCCKRLLQHSEEYTYGDMKI